MIVLELAHDGKPVSTIGTVHRYRDNAFAVGVNWNYKSTLPIRRYLGGAEEPNYPLPALLQDSESRLDVRWSKWYDSDRSYGHRY